ncbi:hypothetical protein B0H12DRAFT_1151862 [Mycena haematopus]|nr:hypothetical protein B0H12DRAFT_1151862 [Mycena haematopus]
MSSDSDSMPDFKKLKDAIDTRHLDSFKDFKLVADPTEPAPRAAFNDLTSWTKVSMAQINQAKANKVYGGRPGSGINFNNVFMAFMESAAMYLRDTSRVIEAVEAYRSGKDAETYLGLLDRSTSQISALAEMWNMHFKHPDGHSLLVGPFCGAFIPKDFINNPFIGVAFKGTSVSREVINDLWASTTTQVERLFKSQVSRGFYHPLFSTYHAGAIAMPFKLIQQAVTDISQKATSVITHVTVSAFVTAILWGGAYSSLCYGQLCIEGYGTPKAFLGDLYTFGSPRVSRADYAKSLKGVPKRGSTWRITNKNDYVPKIPASPPFPISMDPFVHVDAQYMIYPNQRPVAQGSEIGTHPTFAFPGPVSPHYVTEYYKSLRFATTRELSVDDVFVWDEKSAAISTLPLTDEIKSVAMQNSIVPEEISFRAYQDRFVGKIKCGSFIGEITAYGVMPGTLNRNPLVCFHASASDSWKSLYAHENRCIFTKSGDETMSIYFVVDDVAVALAQVSCEEGNDISDIEITSSSCVWTFEETEEVAKVSADLADVAMHVFG